MHNWTYNNIKCEMAHRYGDVNITSQHSATRYSVSCVRAHTMPTWHLCSPHPDGRAKLTNDNNRRLCNMLRDRDLHGEPLLARFVSQDDVPHAASNKRHEEALHRRKLEAESTRYPNHYANQGFLALFSLKTPCSRTSLSRTAADLPGLSNPTTASYQLVVHAIARAAQIDDVHIPCAELSYSACGCLNGPRGWHTRSTLFQVATESKVNCSS